ncbi:MAG TPA: YbjN domain-containing protein [Candidatus Caenarcaniphilales bacterium]|nr:YbjN domain-containing protein [Candidatus Caenarcaniphilales bacterium]
MPAEGTPDRLREVPSAPASSAPFVERWLDELGLEPIDRGEREGVVSWDLLLDGRARRRVRLTLILPPALGIVVWVHYAPPLTDGLRKAYRRLLRWNDELPFAKFALAEDERPVLTTEVPSSSLSRDSLGAAIARSLALCDLLYEESIDWLQPRDRKRVEPVGDPEPAGPALLDRYATELGELAELVEAGESGKPGDAAELGESGEGAAGHLLSIRPSRTVRK